MEFEELVGKTFTDIVTNNHENVVYFTDSDGGQYMMYHNQDCCENVYLAEVIGGELSDLVGEKILFAEKVEQSISSGRYNDDEMWTFYKLSTNKTSITLRWVGSSNGYYSISVDFVKTK
jgi:hypothetical protein